MNQCGLTVSTRRVARPEVRHGDRRAWKTCKATHFEDSGRATQLIDMMWQITRGL